MPEFDITSPDGRKFHITGPPGSTKQQALERVRRQVAAEPTAEPEPPSTSYGDIARSFGRGVAKGAIGVAGLPGDVSRLIGGGVEYLGSKLGLPEPPPEAAPRGLPPTSAQITRGVEKIAGPMGTPETEAGRYAESIGEFVPGAMLTPGGVGAAGKLAVKGVSALAGGAGAQAGAETAEAFGVNPEIGRFAGGLVGSLGAGAAGIEGTAAKLRGALREKAGEEAATKSAKTAYGIIENAQLRITPTARDDFVTDVQKALEQKVLIQQSSPRTYSELDKLQQGKSDIAALMATYERLGNVVKGDDGEAATIVRGMIGTLLDRLTPQEVIAGDPKFTSAMWQHARDEWRAAQKLKDVRRANEIAKKRAAKSGTGANIENTLRQEFDKILSSEKRSRGYAPEQKDQLENIVVGDIVRNTARWLGKYAPSGPVSAGATILAGLEAGIPWGIAVALSATTMKYLGEYLTRRQIAQLEEMLMRASPLGKKAGVPEAPRLRVTVPVSFGQTYLGAGAGSPLAPPQE